MLKIQMDQLGDKSLKINKPDIHLKMMQHEKQSIVKREKIKIIHLSYKTKPNIIKMVHNKENLNLKKSVNYLKTVSFMKK